MSVSGDPYKLDASAPAGGREPPARETPEARLFRSARAGDRGAFGQIVQLYQHRLYNALFRTVGDADEAMELTQETFAQALAGIGGFRGDSQPYTWLFRIGMNAAINRLRKVARRRVFSLGSAAEGPSSGRQDQAATLVERLADSREADPAHQAERREMQDRVLAALGRLDSEYRAILVMRDVEGFGYQQMADVLGLPVGTVKSRLFRARLALRDEFKAK